MSILNVSCKLSPKEYNINQRNNLAYCQVHNQIMWKKIVGIGIQKSTN